MDEAILEYILQLCNHAKAAILAKSAYNGKILCAKFNPQKHTHLANREVISIWPSVKLHKDIFGASTHPILECFLHGDVEYAKEHGKDGKDENA